MKKNKRKKTKKPRRKFESTRRKTPKIKKNAKKEDDDPGIEVFLRACQFVNPRRERFRGQDVLVFDFEPNPEFKAHKLAEKVVQKLAGVVWIDEKSHDVARLEAYFVGDFKLAGGMLANLQRGTSFVFEQAFTNNEVWLPTYAEVHVGVRVLLVKGFKVNAVIRYSDYQRFNVESISTLGKPKTNTDAPGSRPDRTSAFSRAAITANCEETFVECPTNLCQLLWKTARVKYQRRRKVLGEIRRRHGGLGRCEIHAEFGEKSEFYREQSLQPQSRSHPDLHNQNKYSSALNLPFVQ